MDSFGQLFEEQDQWNLGTHIDYHPSTWFYEEDYAPELRESMWGHFNSEAFTQRLRPRPHANEVLREIGHRGYAFALISDRPRVQLAWLIDWLEAHDFPPMTVVTTGCDNGVSKQEVATKFGISIAIDDAPHHIVAYRGMGVTPIIPAYPYNEDEQDCLAFVDWRDVLDFHWPEYRAVR